MTSNLSYEESMRIIQSGFSEKKWSEVHNWLAQNFDWCKERRIPLDVSVENLRDRSLLSHHEQIGLQLLEARYPYIKMDGYRSVIEIGALWGRFSFYLAVTKQLNICACEISDIMVNSMNLIAERNNIENFIATKTFVEHLSTQRKYCDFIFAFETLEHVWDIDKSLSEIYLTLSRGGCLVFSVPIGNYADGGFHIHKCSKDFWVDKVREHLFDVIEIVEVDNNQRIIGLVRSPKNG